MKIWIVNFSSYGMKLDAVVIHESGGQAVALLKLGTESRLYDVTEIGMATGNLTPRIVTEDKLA